MSTILLLHRAEEITATVNIHRSDIGGGCVTRRERWRAGQRTGKCGQGGCCHPIVY